MPKKGTNIFKRKDGRWEARYVKYVTADGEKKYGSVYGKTFTEAKEKQELCIRNNRLCQSKNQNLTLANLMYEWLEFTKNSIPVFLMATLNQYRSHGSVLKNRNGKPVEPRLMQLTFEKYVNECGLPKTNFHALRHTFATRCVEAGFDIKSLSEILGHTDVKTTLNKYVHSSLEQKQKNMELLKPVVSL